MPAGGSYFLGGEELSAGDGWRGSVEGEEDEGAREKSSDIGMLVIDGFKAHGQREFEFDAVSLFDLPFLSTLYRVFLFPGSLQVDLSFTPGREFGALGPKFRLLFGSLARTQHPRLHGGTIVLSAACTTPCQLSVTGHLTLGRERVSLVAVSRTLAAGHHRFRVNLSRRNRAILLRTIGAHRNVRALLTIGATRFGAPNESTGAPVQVQLRP